MSLKRWTMSAVSFAVVTGLAFVSFANAATFNKNRIIDDPVFDNTATMSIGQINTFLNGFSSSCISPNNGFQAIDPTGYSPSGGYTYGKDVSAGQVIYDASLAYGLNPQVLISTLEKEEGLVTGGSGCSSWRYVSAVGYGCPDSQGSYTYKNVNLYSLNGHTVTSISGTCVNSAAKAGFSQQLIHAAWLFKFGEQRSQGNVNWNVQHTNYPQNGDKWDNSDDPTSCYGGPMTQGFLSRGPSQCGGAANYNGNDTIDGQTVHMDNGATAALYWYTPHFSGNQHFFNIFTDWFGPTFADAYQALWVSQSSNPALDPGQPATVSMTFKNNGSTTWYDQTSVDNNQAPDWAKPTHLATMSPINRSSDFAGGNWGSSNDRPTNNFAAVYDINGNLYSTNPHAVAPGESARFDFVITVPANYLAGTYKETFTPVNEGGSGIIPVKPTSPWFTITVNPVYSASWFNQSAATNQRGGQTAQVFLTYKNTSNAPWYDDTSISKAPSGTKPIHLATTNPTNRVSTFASSSWGSSSRPANNFDTVYNSSGVAYSTNPHVVQPNEMAKFAFSFTVPENYPAGAYKEYFAPVNEGGSGIMGNGVSVWLTINVQPDGAVAMAPTANTTINPLATKTVSYSFRNSGTTTWSSATTNLQVVNGDASALKDSSWISNTVLAPLNQTSVAPGATGSFTVTYDAPITDKVYSFSVAPAISGSTIGATNTQVNVTVPKPVYQATFHSESNGAPTIAQNTASPAFFEFKNTGNVAWLDDTSITAGVHPVHLAATNPINRASKFGAAFAKTDRPDFNFSAVYESDGVTLAANQHRVEVGQIAKFSFVLTAPQTLATGTYREYFQPILEGGNPWSMGNYAWLDVTVAAASNKAQFYTQSAYPTIHRGNTASVFISYKNVGNLAWLDDTSVTAGLKPVHMAATNPINRISQFSAAFATPSRPDLIFSAVYESNGTTLATNQHVVQPGQIAKFQFTLTAPASMKTGLYREYFQPILEGGNPWSMGNYAWLDVTVN
ncbi:MAG TPA: hypothetical protein VG604_01770 [Candidatus Saccharimonadales bacterium]|nr:hypothetical protein [Candidatus Saccharimonadales bacterium]